MVDHFFVAIAIFVLVWCLPAPASPQEQVHGSQLNPSVRFQEVLLHPLACRPLVKMSDLTPSLFALGWWVLNLYGTHDIHHT